MDTAKRAPYTVCLLIWVAKLETSHVLQSNKNITYRGCFERFLLSMGHGDGHVVTVPAFIVMIRVRILLKYSIFL